MQCRQFKELSQKSLQERDLNSTRNNDVGKCRQLKKQLACRITRTCDEGGKRGQKPKVDIKQLRDVIRERIDSVSLNLIKLIKS